MPLLRDAPAGTEQGPVARQITPPYKVSGTFAIRTPPVRPPSVEIDLASVQRSLESHDQAATEARLAQIAEALERGKSALARKDYAAVINAYRMAASLAPDDAKVQATCNEAILTAAGALADGFWKQALHEESEGRWEEAALSYSRVCLGRPGDAQAHERAANAALKSSNVRRAVELARRAIELSPGTALYRVTLARAYAAAGFEKSCQSELDRALELAGDDAKIRSLISRVRSGSQKTGKAS
jgi:tetratricopeptide (TPR) repeat protein